MHVIMFATFNESKYLVALVGGSIDDSHKKPPYVIKTRRKNMVVYICGMGRAAAERAARLAITSLSPSMIINAGICGALSGGAAIGDIFQVKRAVMWPNIKYIDTFYSDSSLDSIPQADLVTSAKPVFDPKMKIILGKYGHIVDMEGAGIARACKEHNVPCLMLKGVSDMAEKGGRKLLQKNIAPVSKKLAQIILKYL